MQVPDVQMSSPWFALEAMPANKSHQGQEYGNGTAWGAGLNPATDRIGHHCVRTYTTKTRCSIRSGLLRVQPSVHAKQQTKSTYNHDPQH